MVAPECPGIFYRVVDQSHVAEAGTIRFVREYRRRKRLSCPGCVQCAGLAEAWTDAPGIPDGALVRLYRREGWPHVEIIEPAQARARITEEKDENDLQKWFKAWNR